MHKEAYQAGFAEKCRKHGIDPQTLIKAAQETNAVPPVVYKPNVPPARKAELDTRAENYGQFTQPMTVEPTSAFGAKRTFPALPDPRVVAGVATPAAKPPPPVALSQTGNLGASQKANIQRIEATQGR